jgi:hypothetical protein
MIKGQKIVCTVEKLKNEVATVIVRKGLRYVLDLKGVKAR